MKRLTTILLSAGLLAACSEPQYSAQYYKEHPEKMKAKVAECKKMENAAEDKNCIAAHSASFLQGEFVPSSHKMY